MSDFDQLHCQQGIFVTCDAAMSELIRHLNGQRALGCVFILEQLDRNHFLLDASKVPNLEKELEAHREKLFRDVNEQD